MKLDEATKHWQDGNLILMAEYRGYVTETINYRDKTTGRPAVMHKLTHNIELGNTALQVSERVKDDFNPEKYTSPAKKGQKVLWRITGLMTEKGVTKASGVIEVLN